MSSAPPIYPDAKDLLTELLEAGADFVVVGAHALGAHGYPRATGDFDVLVRPTSDNSERVFEALVRFGAPIQAHQVTRDTFARPGAVYQLGVPPGRFDILTRISGVDFTEAWAGKIHAEMAGLSLFVLGRSELIKNKLASGRHKDLADVELLEHAASMKPK